MCDFCNQGCLGLNARHVMGRAQRYGALYWLMQLCGCADDYGADDVITPAAYAAHAQRWVKLGATIIGGCCAVGPQHIKHMAEVIK